MNYMLWGYENVLTILLSIIGFVIVIYAQFRINSSYSKYRRVKANCGLSGQEVARKILDSNGLDDIHIVEVKGGENEIIRRNKENERRKKKWAWP